MNLGPQVNTSLFEEFAFIAGDGSAVYFDRVQIGTPNSGDIWYAPIIPIVDFNGDGVVDTKDLAKLIDSWGQADPLCDIGPFAWGDGVVDERDLRVLMESLMTPGPKATDVPCEVVLTWLSPSFANACDVYVGTSFEAVNTAGRTDPQGVLVSQGQMDTVYVPQEPLEFSQTYYWRVDFVIPGPTPTIYQGPVLKFTTEAFAYPIQNVTATASSTQAGMGPEKTVDGSGLDRSDGHSTDVKDMWLSMMGVVPHWIQYEFDQVHALHELWVWNSNQLVEPFMGFGARTVKIEYSTDGTTWTPLAGVPEFAQATGKAGYMHNTTVSFGGVLAKFVKLTIEKGWGTTPMAGLSEVRFYYLPVRARAPIPADGATGVAVDANLTWRPGREAATHQVFMGTDAATLPLVDTIEVAAYAPELDFNQTYFWKIMEVNEAETPSFWDSDVWSFTTGSFLPIDDFESYNDDIDADTTIYQTWIDGVTDGASGSQVGYEVAPFAERRTAHGGRQSMPLQYDNSVSPFFSQAERTFDSPQDWTIKGADTLSLYFRGIWTNAPTFMEMATGSIVMNARGWDIWLNSDEFRFAYKTLNGNGTIIARVESLHPSDPWAKGGVMIRESLEPGSRFAIVCATPGNGVRFQARSATNVGAISDTPVVTPEQVALQTPVWVKLERSANSFSGFYSIDGVNWTPMSWNPQTINMVAPTVYVGLALCSHQAAAATSAEFSNIRMTGNVTGDWQVAEIGGKQPEGNPVEGVYVTVTDSAGNAKTVVHPDAAATGYVSWQHWEIPTSEFISGGVRMDAVTSMAIGVGNKLAPVQGGTGTLLVDDIGFGKSAGQ